MTQEARNRDRKLVAYGLESPEQKLALEVILTKVEDRLNRIDSKLESNTKSIETLTLACRSNTDDALKVKVGLQVAGWIGGGIIALGTIAIGFWEAYKTH